MKIIFLPLLSCHFFLSTSALANREATLGLGAIAGKRSKTSSIPFNNDQNTIGMKYYSSTSNTSIKFDDNTEKSSHKFFNRSIYGILNHKDEKNRINNIQLSLNADSWNYSDNSNQDLSLFTRLVFQSFSLGISTSFIHVSEKSYDDQYNQYLFNSGLYFIESLKMEILYTPKTLHLVESKIDTKKLVGGSSNLVIAVAYNIEDDFSLYMGFSESTSDSITNNDKKYSSPSMIHMTLGAEKSMGNFVPRIGISRFENFQTYNIGTEIPINNLIISTDLSHYSLIGTDSSKNVAGDLEFIYDFSKVALLIGTSYTYHENDLSYIEVKSKTLTLKAGINTIF